MIYILQNNYTIKVGSTPSSFIHIKNLSHALVSLNQPKHYRRMNTEVVLPPALSLEKLFCIIVPQLAHLLNYYKDNIRFYCLNNPTEIKCRQLF